MASLGVYAARRRVPASGGSLSWDYGRREEDFRRQDERGMEVVRGAVAVHGAVAVGRRVGAGVVVPPLASRKAAAPASAPAPVAVLGARKVAPGRLAPLNVPAVKPETVGPWKTKAAPVPEPVIDPMSLHARLVCMGRVSVAERLPPSRYDS